MELCSIHGCDACLYTSHCSLLVESSKTVQLREGAWIINARSGKVTCPVAALERYLAAAGIKLDEEFPLFHALAPPKSSVKVCQHVISYTRARALVKEALKDITDASKISLHSLRSGGASGAANASENAKHCYVKDNLDFLLSVSRPLGT